VLPAVPAGPGVTVEHVQPDAPVFGAEPACCR
jgi:hypothetical protein